LANSRWNVVSSPNVAGASDAILYAIAAASDSAVWAVGNDVDSNGNAQTVIEQWNGSQWSLVASVSPCSGDNILGGITAATANDVWAVGRSANGKNPLTPIEHYCSPGTGAPSSILRNASRSGMYTACRTAPRTAIRYLLARCDVSMCRADR